MKVILAGYPKTGTKSMTAALSVLRYNTYDFFEHWWYHSDQWNKIFTQGGTIGDFKEMYKDVDAVTDMPAFYFWEEIHQAFPDSKIILMLRDEDSWYESYLRQRDMNVKVGSPLLFTAAMTRFNPCRIYTSYQYISNFGRIVLGFSVIAPLNEMICRMKFRRHNEYVIQTAPKDKLLVYKITDGWQPLCEFLSVEVPDQPFPHKNRNCSMRQDFVEKNPIALENIRITKCRMWKILGAITIFISIYLCSVFH